MFLGGHEEGGDGSGLVPLGASNAGSAEDFPMLFTMFFKGVAGEGGEFVTSLMLVLVVLLGFDRRGARRSARGVGAVRWRSLVRLNWRAQTVWMCAKVRSLSSSRSST